MRPKFKFDTNKNLETPILVLCKKSNDKVGYITNPQNFTFTDSMTDVSQLSFDISKEHCNFFEEIKDFRLIYIPDWDEYYQIQVQLDENSSISKSVVAYHLPEAELSQLNLYEVYINTEEDIKREEDTEYNVEGYNVSVFYNKNKPKASILHRVLADAVNFEIGTVDSSLWNINREFSFNGIDIMSALNEIAEEIGCYFVYNTKTASDGKTIRRIVNVYDMENACMNDQCAYYQGQIKEDDELDPTASTKYIRYREENMKVCPKCGSMNIHHGYGVDTSVFFSIENVCDEVSLTSDVDSVKNCLHLDAGDDEITTAAVSLNGGSTSIFYVPDETKAEMSAPLVSAINEYDKHAEEYLNTYDYMKQSNKLHLNSSYVSAYNELINGNKSRTGYKDVNKDDIPDNIKNGALTTISSSLIGLEKLVIYQYDAADFWYYLHDGLMPNPLNKTDDTSAKDQMGKFRTAYEYLEASGNQTRINHVGVQDTTLTNGVLNTIDTYVEKVLKFSIDPRYTVRILSIGTHAVSGIKGTIKKTHTVNNESKTVDVRWRVWQGTIRIDNVATQDLDDDDPKADYCQENFQIIVSDDYEYYIKDLLDVKFQSLDTEDYSIVGLFKKPYDEFKADLKKYSLMRLTEFNTACDAAIDVMISKGDSDKDITDVNKQIIYNNIYLPYHAKSQAIQDEMVARSDEIKIIESFQEDLDKLIEKIHALLNFEWFVKSKPDGNHLWSEYVSFRRDGEYSNSNYTSDNLKDNNTLTVMKGKQFLEAARKEIKKSSILQQSITVSLKNIFAIKEFEPMMKQFDLGNWIHVEINRIVYKLRILDYSINWNDFMSSSVTFSNVLKSADGILSDLQGIVSNFNSMSSSYSYLQRQADIGAGAYKSINDLLMNGFDPSQTPIKTYEENLVYNGTGLLARAYDPEEDKYLDDQMKITHNMIVFTDDNWKSTTCGLGRFDYNKFTSNGTKVSDSGYGLNARFVKAGTIEGSQIIAGDIYSTKGDIHMYLGEASGNANGTFILKSNNVEALKFADGSLIIGGSNGITYNTSTKKMTLGSDVSISWNDIGGKPDKIITDNNKGTYITKDFIKTLKVEAGSVAAENITGTTITGKKLSGGSIDINNGVFKVTDKGALTATSATIEGKITATQGSIGGWRLSSDTIVSDNKSTNATSTDTGTRYAAYIGKYGNTSAHGNAFGVWISKWNSTTKAAENEWVYKVDYNGKLYAKNVEIKGGTLSIGSTFSVSNTGVLNASGATITGGIDATSIKIKQNLQMYPANDASKAKNVMRVTSSNSSTATGGTLDTIFIGDDSTWDAINFSNTATLIRSGGMALSNGLEVSSGGIEVTGTSAFLSNKVSVCAGHIDSHVDSNGTGGSHRYIWRPTSNGGALLGTTSVRWSSVYCTAGAFNTSDKKLKNHIEYLVDDENVEAFFDDLKPVMYTLKEGTGHRHHMGMYSQDVSETALKTIGDIAAYQAVIIDENGNEHYYEPNNDISDEKLSWTMSYSEFIAPTIAVLQKTRKHVTELEEKISMQDDKIAQLENKIEQLTALVEKFVN